MPIVIEEHPNRSVKAATYVYRRRDWVRTPNFRNLARSDLPTNPYEDEAVTMSQNLYSGLQSTNLSNGAVAIDYPAGYLRSGLEIWNMLHAAITDSGFDAKANGTFNDCTVALLMKVSDMKANLAVTFREASKTSSLILDTARRVDRAYRAFRKGNLREVARNLNLGYYQKDRSHKTWLEYKYGWMPLLMEVKGAAEFFAQQTMGGRPLRFTASASKTMELHWSKTTQFQQYGSPYPNSGSNSENLWANYSCRQKLWLEVVNPNLAHLQQLGVTNPALVAWELVPYSFVFDWFVSVGDWLQAQTALHGLTVRKSMRSNVNVFKYMFRQPRSIVTNGGYRYENGERLADSDKRHYARGTLTIDAASLSIPKHLPGDPFPKLVTALSLLKSRR